MSIRRIACALLLVILAAPAFGAEKSPPKSVANDPRVAQALELARTWLEAQRAYDRIPGVSAEVVYDQEVLWSGGFGLADVETKRTATAETLYSICSISKLFTSVAVLQQRDEGKIHLEDPVGKYLPWFDIGPDGRATRFTQHSNHYPRIR